MDDDGECGYSEMEGELCGKTALTQNFEDQAEDEEGSLEPKICNVSIFTSLRQSVSSFQI